MSDDKTDYQNLNECKQLVLEGVANGSIGLPELQLILSAVDYRLNELTTNVTSTTGDSNTDNSSSS